MIPTLVITLREGVEAALDLGIIAAFSPGRRGPSSRGCGRNVVSGVAIPLNPVPLAPPGSAVGLDPEIGQHVAR